jgi:pimeloyl-ACP methyl ester carboxylesterase
MRGWAALTTLAWLAACAEGGAVRRTEVRLADGSTRPVWVAGAGRDTVLAVPGGPGLPGRYLAEALAPLGASHTVIVAEAPGAGLRARQATGEGSYDPTWLAADLDTLRLALGLRRVTLVAHDHGALVAARFAIDRPGHVARLVLVAPFPPRHRYVNSLVLRGAPPSVDTALRAAIADSSLWREPARACPAVWPAYLAPNVEPDSAVVRALALPLCEAGDDALRAVMPIREAGYRALPNWEWRDSLRAVPVPTLVIAGTRDTLLLHAQRSWAAWMPDARIVELAAGALAPWMADGDAVIGAVAAFLAGGDVAGSRRPALHEVVAPGDTVAPPGVSDTTFRRVMDSLAGPRR